MRIEKAPEAPHHVPMDEQQAQDLVDEAVHLTYLAFGDDATDDHVEWVFQRLAINWLWGADAAGAVTVH